jgi:hypothetical protein
MFSLMKMKWIWWVTLKIYSSDNLWYFRFSWWKVWRWLSSGLLRCVVWYKFNDVSRVPVAYIIRGHWGLTALMLEAARISEMSTSMWLHGATTKKTAIFSYFLVSLQKTRSLAYKLSKKKCCFKPFKDNDEMVVTAFKAS